MDGPDAASVALAKATRRLIPFMFVLYVVAYLDRINVGFAALQMRADLGFDDRIYGLGAGIFFVGYFLFEVPSNLLLERLGARLWIARIMVTWGLIASAMMLVRGVRSFFLLRFLLGVAEAGFFPGMILYLTYWFPAAERAHAVARFMTATAIAGVVGGPISGVLLAMDGVGGLRGWQWLFLAGVPRRFPELRFAFLEGGVAWACDLYAGIVGHWEKRHGEHLEHYDPAHLDRALLADLFRRHGAPGVTARLDRLAEGLTCLSEPDEDRATLDEFAAAGIRRVEDIRDVFVQRFHFGCEADDRLAAVAFDTRVHPLGARLKAIFSSDIGHWDVPDMREVLPEAYALVETGVLGEEAFRDFVFANAASLWAGVNPDFFAGTAVESAVAALAG